METEPVLLAISRPATATDCQRSPGVGRHISVSEYWALTKPEVNFLIRKGMHADCCSRQFSISRPYWHWTPRPSASRRRSTLGSRISAVPFPGVAQAAIYTSPPGDTFAEAKEAVSSMKQQTRQMLQPGTARRQKRNRKNRADAGNSLRMNKLSSSGKAPVMFRSYPDRRSSCLTRVSH